MPLPESPSGEIAREAQRELAERDRKRAVTHDETRVDGIMRSFADAQAHRAASKAASNVARDKAREMRKI